MLIENISTEQNEEFKKTFEEAVKNIPQKIKVMLKEKNIKFIIADYVDDTMSEERKKKQDERYKDDIVKKETTRGLMSDEIDCIVVSAKNTKIEHIEAILYHEVGHFLDAYDNFGQVDEFGLSLSSKEEFVNAYTKDFADNYEQIKLDTNFRLVHFVQKSTPENINDAGIMESFAELFRHASGKINDTKTVELYFPTALQTLKQIVNERFDLEF